jgi:hypothetical protein
MDGTIRRVWGFRLVGRELAGLPDFAHLHFMWLWRQLGASDVAPDGIWQLYGRQLWIYEITAAGRIYRMAIEIMPEGWVMVWAHGAAAVLRRRLDQRLLRVG